MVAVANKRLSLTRGSNIVILHGNFWYFGKIVAILIRYILVVIRD